MAFSDNTVQPDHAYHRVEGPFGRQEHASRSHRHAYNTTTCAWTYHSFLPLAVPGDHTGAINGSRRKRPGRAAPSRASASAAASKPSASTCRHKARAHVSAAEDLCERLA